jgi:hypothetical protein
MSHIENQEDLTDVLVSFLEDLENKTKNNDSFNNWKYWVWQNYLPNKLKTEVNGVLFLLTNGTTLARR